jgi:hypothetical protein
MRSIAIVTCGGISSRSGSAAAENAAYSGDIVWNGGAIPSLGATSGGPSCCRRGAAWSASADSNGRVAIRRSDMVDAGGATGPGTAAGERSMGGSDGITAAEGPTGSDRSANGSLGGITEINCDASVVSVAVSAVGGGNLSGGARSTGDAVRGAVTSELTSANPPASSGNPGIGSKRDRGLRDRSGAPVCGLVPAPRWTNSTKRALMPLPGGRAMPGSGDGARSAAPVSQPRSSDMPGRCGRHRRGSNPAAPIAQ